MCNGPKTLRWASFTPLTARRWANTFGRSGAGFRVSGVVVEVGIVQTEGDSDRMRESAGDNNATNMVLFIRALGTCRVPFCPNFHLRSIIRY